MFDFFRKRSVKTAGASFSKQADPPAIAEVTVSARDIALAQVAELAGDEPAAVAFILHCEFADARLMAAEYVYSRPMVEQVLQAMRNSDRRVVKLMQARLDSCKQWEADEQRAHDCIAQAQQLQLSPQLTPNQVADLDRQWQKIQHVAPPLHQSYEDARKALQQRLAAQAALQRALLDIQAQLRSWVAAGHLALSADAADELADLEQQVAQLAASTEAPSLPKNLLPDCALAATEVRRLLQQQAEFEQAIAERRTLLEQWEAAEPGALTAPLLLQAWGAAPMLPASEIGAALQARLDALLLHIAQPRTSAQSAVLPPAAVKPDDPDLQARFATAVASMEQALQTGALQAAAEQDKILRALEPAQAGRGAAQAARLSRLRVELGRLQGWAKWGGQVSREELLHAAEALPVQALPVAELAKKVGGLRDQWKSLDASAGPAGKELWQRFDQACTVAYAPVAAHYAQLAAERMQNAARAQALLDECRLFANQFHASKADVGQRDWKTAAGFLEHMRQSWRRLGTIDRKDKKRLDTEFDTVLGGLAGLLSEQRSLAAQQREGLIAEAAALNPHERDTLDALRQLQDRWQQQSRAMPLERRQEQALWQRFREQCDRVFAERKQVAQAADVDRRQHLSEKSALCVRLETAQSDPQASIAKLLRETRDAWGRIGPVPRAEEDAVNARYRQAEQVLQQRLQDARLTARAASLAGVQVRLHLCQELEQLLADGADGAADQLEKMQEQWAATSAAEPEYEHLLQARFAAAASALQARDHQYLLRLELNHATLLEALLRLEISAGLESPPQFARERLQQQVTVLQSSLKTGLRRDATASNGQLAQLCELPALVDASTSQRIDRILDWFKSGAVPLS